jgi:hypothetical protein
MALLVILTMPACGGSSQQDSPEARERRIAEAMGLNQTWTKNYGETTCAEWNGRMTEHERYVAAADILTSARTYDGGTGLPPELLLRRFQGDVTEACSAALAENLTVAEVGATVYLIGTDQYEP